jgi:proteasome accessory factor C
MFSIYLKITAMRVAGECAIVQKRGMKMSYKFDSLIAILNKLDRGNKVTVNSLMDDLKVSQRTAYRYMQTLQVTFPISFNRRKGSYVFDEGFSLRKPDLSVEETLAFALSKKFLSNFGTGMEKSLDSIEKKLSQKKADLPKHIILSAEIPQETEKYLGVIHQAIYNFQKIEMVYKALYSDDKTKRVVDPYYLFFQDGYWHPRGYCHLREDYRTFALDKIASLSVLDKHFLPKILSPEDELSGSFGSIIDGEPVEVVLNFDAEVKTYVLRKKWHQSQKATYLDDGKLEMRFHVNGTEGIKGWIYQWLPYVEVVAPEELRDKVHHDLQEAMVKVGKPR